MTLEELKKIMASTENEHLEFKEAKSSFSILGNSSKNRRSVLGYCVALGNEGGGKLILGISDIIPRKILGTHALNNLTVVKSKIYNHLKQRIKIEELFEDSKRIIVIYIPSRPIGETFKFYGTPLMRVGEELVDMDDSTLKKILSEDKPDWSATLCPNATIEDLDTKAISVAKENFKIKNPRIAKEVDKWNNETFLNKAKITIKSSVTNTAILLLGKEEASTLISPSVAQITWILKGGDGNAKDYKHYSCPLLLAVDKVHQKIRNLKYRYIKNESLFPEEIDMYDPNVIREALHNCIAHQDYSLRGRIQVVENEEGFLVFTNKGQFLPGSIEQVLQTETPQEYYQNKFLVDAMVNLNMIDTIGSGIKKMFNIQQKRFFPMPSYDLARNKVSVKIYGKVIDLKYANILAQHKELSLIEIMLLDHIQKKKRISKEDAKKLRKKKLIEGRYPNICISSQVAKTTGEKTQYINNVGFQDKYYKDLIIEYLKEYPNSSREDINLLILDKLPKVLNKKQRTKKVANLLSSLSKREKRIINKGTNRNPKWNIKE